MKVVGVYSFNGGKEFIEDKHPKLLEEVRLVISKVNASEYFTKESAEKTMPGKTLYSPTSFNIAFDKEFQSFGWRRKRIKCDYPKEYYVDGYEDNKRFKSAFREIDYLKDKLGIEVQFGKYSFMVYNVAAK